MDLDVPLIDEPLLARTLRLASPSYRVGYPDIARKSDIPGDVMRAMDQAFTRGRQPVRPVTFYRLRGVYVCAEGLVFDQDLRLYRSTLAQHPPEVVAEARAMLEGRRARGDIPVHAGPVLLCKKIGSFNYGHWLVEMLPRAVLARHRLGVADLRYLVHVVANPMRKVVTDTLALAGIAPDQVMETGNEPHFFEDLILVEGLSEHGGYMSPLCIDALEHCAARVRTGHAERIYVTRRSAQWRHFRDEERMAEIAQREGYSLVDPGEMSVVQQMMVFKGARRVVGMTGAGITNVAFCAPGAEVRLFVPRSMPDTFFWYICQIRRHSYAEYRCPEIDTPARDAMPRQAWNNDIDVTEDAFRRFLLDS